MTRPRRPSPSFSFQPVRLAVEGGEGLLVFANGLLAGVLARPSDQHGEDVGYWFLEAAGNGLLTHRREAGRRRRTYSAHPIQPC